MIAWLRGIALLGVVAVGAYLFGLYSYPRNLWPHDAMRKLDKLVNSTRLAGTYGGLGGLVAYPDKIEAPCPRQTDSTAVLLAIGQSNAANHAARKAATRHPAAVLNWCSRASALSRRRRRWAPRARLANVRRLRLET